jgi:threonine aldolase
MPPDTPIDLRSDTVTKPSPAMREAIASAPVGDDQYGEDPSANLLQERIATLLGKEAALWFPTGTMANQVALRTLTRPGDDVIVSQEAHSVWHEAGGSAANSSVQFTVIGAGGLFTAEQFVSAIYPRSQLLMYPPTTLVEIENTHNRAGGIIFPQDEVVKIGEAARQHNVATYLDGARLWNVSAATGNPMDVLAAPADVVMVALSKGLGAPGGSVLAGTKDFILKAMRYRRMMGGAMRQIGLFAAAGLYALDHNVARLKEDHDNARLIGERLAQSPRVLFDISTAQTNILVFGLTEDFGDAPGIVARAKERGVLLNAMGPRKIRAVTHLDVTREQCAQAADILIEVINT